MPGPRLLFVLVTIPLIPLLRRPRFFSHLSPTHLQQTPLYPSSSVKDSYLYIYGIPLLSAVLPSLIISAVD